MHQVYYPILSTLHLKLSIIRKSIQSKKKKRALIPAEAASRDRWEGGREGGGREGRREGGRRGGQKEAGEELSTCVMI